jgi:uncharacterized lipoprotein YajG
MKNLLTSRMFAILIGLFFIAATAKAQNTSTNQNASTTPIEGVVKSVTGSRMTIQRADGQTQDVTAKEKVPQTLVGKTVTGNIKPVGDTNLIIDFVTKN